MINAYICFWYYFINYLLLFFVHLFGLWKFWSSTHKSKMEMSKCLTIKSLMKHLNNLQKLKKSAGLIPCRPFLGDPRKFVNLNMRLFGS